MTSYYEQETIISEQEKTIKELKIQNSALVCQMEIMAHNLALLKRAVFGKKSEKSTQMEADQFDLKFGEAEEEQGDLDPEDDDEPEIKTAPKKRGRKKLPDDLPRKKIIYDLADELKICPCGSALTLIGEDKSEQLDYIPATLQVIEHIRLKYACKSCEDTILRAPVPIKPLPKANATAGFLSNVIVSKVEDHLPLNRQSMMLKRHGIDINRGTLCNWVIGCAKSLNSLPEFMRRDMAASNYVCSDETTLNVLDCKKAKSYMWVHMSGDRDRRAVVFDYQPTREGKSATTFLDGFAGAHQCDAYSGYKALHRKDCVYCVACWAHARRKFFEITKVVKTPGLAHKIVKLVQKLYKIEREAIVRQLAPSQIKDLRQLKSTPILAKIKILLDDHKKTTPPKSPLGKAIAYSLNNWDDLNTYLQDGRIRIDNNDCERIIRPFAIGRKNWMFSASTRGAEASATLYSIIATCKANKINPYDYLRYVLIAIKTATTDDEIISLLPYNIDKNLLGR